MSKEPEPPVSAEDDETPLTISPEKVCFIIIKAREFDVKDAVADPDPGSNPSDDRDAAVLEDHKDDPVVEELTSLINALSVDEQVDLVALAWLGRDDYSAEDWRGGPRGGGGRAQPTNRGVSLGCTLGASGTGWRAVADPDGKLEWVEDLFGRADIAECGAYRQ